MKRDDILIGVGAGLVSAVLFATLIKVTLAAILLFFLAPLPVAIVALGWNHRSGLLASVVGTLALGLVFDWLTGLLFALAFALPAWWLSYLALLARGGSAPAHVVAAPAALQSDEHWYPLGGLALWAGFLCVLLTLGYALMVSFDYATYRAVVEALIRSALGNVIEELTRLGADTSLVEEVPRAFASLFVPASAAVSALLMLIILLIAAKLVAMSGRLPRPMPHIARDFALPRASLFGLAGGIGLATLPGWPRFVAIALLASLALFFALQGLATAHILLARVSARPVILGVGYALIVFATPWMLIGLALLGLAEMALSLRARKLAAAPASKLH